MYELYECSVFGVLAFCKFVSVLLYMQQSLICLGYVFICNCWSDEYVNIGYEEKHDEC